MGAFMWLLTYVCSHVCLCVEPLESEGACRLVKAHTHKHTVPNDARPSRFLFFFFFPSIWFPGPFHSQVRIFSALLSRPSVFMSLHLILSLFLHAHLFGP